MILFPAIDLKDGKVVRLQQGDYDQMTVYSEDPLAVARSFKEAGATHLHVVDLDGARGGNPINFRTVERLIQSAGLEVQVGGGIRNRERIETYLNVGAKRVILGTAAVTDPTFLKKMIGLFGEAIAVGVDVKDGMAAINGWEKTTVLNGVEFCKSLVEIGVKTVIYTDIAKDGEMQGTNMEAYRELAQIKGLNIIASGGISFEEEIVALKDLVYGAILGKALYGGMLDLATCVRLAERSGQ